MFGADDGASVVVLAAIQIDQNGQRPGSRGEGELHQNGEDHPFVAVSPSGVGMRRTDRIAVSGLGVNGASGVAIDGVVADECNRLIVGEPGDDELCEDTTESDSRPLCPTEDAAISGHRSGCEVLQCPQNACDGTSSGGEERRGDECLKSHGGWFGEFGGESREQRCGFLW